MMLKLETWFHTLPSMFQFFFVGVLQDIAITLEIYCWHSLSVCHVGQGDFFPYLHIVLDACSLTANISCSSVIPYFYPIYLFILLIWRERRDEARCSQKYKEVWVEYCKVVPWRILPFVYQKSICGWLVHAPQTEYFQKTVAPNAACSYFLRLDKELQSSNLSCCFCLSSSNI